MSDYRLSKRAFLKSVTAALGLGCGGSLKHFPFDTMNTAFPTLGLELSFYGVGCFGFRYNGVQVLTDPFFTYLPLRTVAVGKVLPDPEQVDPYLDNFTDVKAMLVGHAHYDHNLDLPYIAKTLNEDCFVLGSKTLRHTFAPNNLPTPFVDMNDKVASKTKLGQWWVHPSKKFRVLPIVSAHPNQYLFFHLYKEEVNADRTTIPSKVHHYQEGMTFAFLLDFFPEDANADNAKPSVRIYIQSSSTGFPMGAFPKEILEEKEIDVACLAMDCANLKMKGETTVIDEYPAKTTFFCHYEDFFRRKDQVPREIVKVDLPAAKEFFSDVSNKEFLFPIADSVFNL